MHELLVEIDVIDELAARQEVALEVLQPGVALPLVCARYYLKSDSYRLRGKPRSADTPDDAESAAAGGWRGSHPPSQYETSWTIPPLLRPAPENGPSILRRWRILGENPREKVAH